MEDANRWLFDFQDTHFKIGTSVGQEEEVPKNVKWYIFEIGCLKLNVDATVCAQSRSIGVSAIIRDDAGVGAMAHGVKGCFEPYIAECLTIKQSLAFAQRVDLR